MKAYPRLLTLAALAFLAGAIATPDAARSRGRPKAGPVVVELFTAQGCASCKKANALIAALADKPGLIVLTWSVDYWDYLGWKDTFAQPEFTARQKAFARRLGPEDVYTPQVVVSGLGQVSGDDGAAVDALIQTAKAAPRRQPSIRLMATDRVRIAAGHALAGKAEVWLVRYDPREQDVAVKAGDNRGATVVHKDVVKSVARLGSWRGEPVTFKVPAAESPGLVSVVIVEGPRGGPVIAAAAFKPR